MAPVKEKNPPIFLSGTTQKCKNNEKQRQYSNAESICPHLRKKLLKKGYGFVARILLLNACIKTFLPGFSPRAVSLNFHYV